jgi:hypothetical protein
MKKRDLFAELMQGVNEMGEQREGKITLRQYEMEALPAPEVTAAEIVSIRKNCICPSQFLPGRSEPARTP